MNGSEKTPKSQLYLEYLREEGYLPRLDDDGDVVFKRQGGTYYLFSEEGDRPYFRLVYPNFWSIENEDERRKALAVMGEVNATFKVIKVYPTADDTSAAIELFLDPIENFRVLFPRAIDLLAEGVNMFRRQMRGLN